MEIEVKTEHVDERYELGHIDDDYVEDAQIIEIERLGKTNGLCDVTLAYEDSQIKTHKQVISCASLEQVYDNLS